MAFEMSDKMTDPMADAQEHSYLRQLYSKSTLTKLINSMWAKVKTVGKIVIYPMFSLPWDFIHFPVF